MRRMLLPIHPEHVINILNGTKKYEYRKIKSRYSDIDRIIIYSTTPVRKVVGEVQVVNIIIGSPESVWEETKEYSGISKDYFDDYYSGKEFAVAYELGEVFRYKEPKDLMEFGIKYPPQSMVYI